MSGYMILAFFVGMTAGFVLGVGFAILGVKALIRSGDLKQRS